MRRTVGRSALYGVLFGLATAAVAEAVRPRGGTTLLVDWDEVRRAARARLDRPHLDAGQLAGAAMDYRSLADKLEKPLLNFVGPLPKGASLPRFDALDREGWLDLNTTYTYGIVHQKLLADFNRQPAMPFVLIESTYEGEHNASAVQIRRQAYWAILSGATGQFMGNRPMWLFDPGWEAALNSAGAEDMQRLYLLFTSRSWYDLVPDQKHEVVVDGLGEFNGMDYLAAARSADGGTVMAYLPTTRTITIEMGKVSGTLAAAWWFNPRTGQATSGGKFATTGKKQFTPPADGDWVLVLDDAGRNLSAPGTVR